MVSIHSDRRIGMTLPSSSIFCWSLYLPTGLCRPSFVLAPAHGSPFNNVCLPCCIPVHSLLSHCIFLDLPPLIVSSHESSLYHTAFPYFFCPSSSPSFYSFASSSSISLFVLPFASHPPGSIMVPSKPPMASPFSHYTYCFGKLLANPFRVVCVPLFSSGGCHRRVPVAPSTIQCIGMH